MHLVLSKIKMEKIPAMLGQQKKALNVIEKHSVVLRGAALLGNPRVE